MEEEIRKSAPENEAQKEPVPENIEKAETLDVGNEESFPAQGEEGFAKTSDESEEEPKEIEQKEEAGQKEAEPEKAQPKEVGPEEVSPEISGAEKGPEQGGEVVEQEVSEERRWYVIQALTGQEDRVKQAIDLTIKSKGLQDKVFQVLVPTEEIKGGKRVERIKKMFPGYVFLEMVLDEESWYLIRETPGVARFIGTKVQPTPVSEKEMQRVLKQLGKEERLEITFEKGEGVRVISGPFRGYTGTVDEVNVEKGKLKVLINIFGRDTPVEVNFEHAQKIV